MLEGIVPFPPALNLNGSEATVIIVGNLGLLYRGE